MGSVGNSVLIFGTVSKKGASAKGKSSCKHSGRSHFVNEKVWSSAVGLRCRPTSFLASSLPLLVTLAINSGHTSSVTPTTFIVILNTRSSPQRWPGFRRSPSVIDHDESVRILCHWLQLKYFLIVYFVKVHYIFVVLGF